MNIKNTPKSVLARVALLVMIPVAVVATAGETQPQTSPNPFFTLLNEPIAYGKVTATHVTEYADTVLANAAAQSEGVRTLEKPTFNNVIKVLDDIERETLKLDHAGEYSAKRQKEIKKVIADLKRSLDKTRDNLKMLLGVQGEHPDAGRLSDDSPDSPA